MPQTKAEEETTVDLASGVTGTLPTGNGGTGATATANAANGVVVLGADGYLANNLVDTTALKTVMSAVSNSGAAWVHNTLPGGNYGFYPQIKQAANNAGVAAKICQENVAVVGTTYKTHITFYPASTTMYAQQRYITASGIDQWIFLLVDKLTKDIVSAYQAPDHPAYGNGGDFEKLPHPFGSYDETKHKIVLVDNGSIREIKSQVTRERDYLTIINEDYRVDMTDIEPYIPLHSGQFLGQKPVMVKTLPEYITVRSLIKLSQQEKYERETKQKVEKQKYEEARSQKMINKTNGIAKLKTLGLLNTEISALVGD